MPEQEELDNNIQRTTRSIIKQDIQNWTISASLTNMDSSIEKLDIEILPSQSRRKILSKNQNQRKTDNTPKIKPSKPDPLFKEKESI